MGAEGVDVFTSGFLMGTIAGPFSRGIQVSTKHLTEGGKYVFSRDAYNEEQTYIKERQEQIKKSMDKFNDMTDAKKDFLREHIEHMVMQAKAKEQQDSAEENNDRKSFEDAKDLSLGYQILFALEMGSYDLIQAQVEDMGKLSNEDLSNAFGEQVGADSDLIIDFKENYEAVMNYMQAISDMSENFDEMFPEVDEYGAEDTDLETGFIEKDDVRIARRHAKMLTVMSQFSLLRTLERQKGLSKSLFGKKSPFTRKDKRPAAVDITKLFNKREFTNELHLLNEEIKNLEAFDKLDPQQKEDLKYKKQLLESFSAIAEGMNTYSQGMQFKAALDFELERGKKERADLALGKTVKFRRGKSTWEGEIIGEAKDAKGRDQWIIRKENGKTTKVLKDSSGLASDIDSNIVTEAPLKKLKKDFVKYLKVLAKQSGNSVN